MTTSIKTQQVFTASSRADGLGPLDAACAWAADRTRQVTDRAYETPMIVLQEEMAPTPPRTESWRRFVVVEISTLLDATRGRSTPAYYNEIVPALPTSERGAPAKLAFDLELKTATDKERAEVAAAYGSSDDVPALWVRAEAGATWLIEAALSELSRLVGRRLTRAEHVVELDSSREGKWSRHVTIDGSDATNESIALASDADCAELVRRLLASAGGSMAKELALLVDRSVYTSRHPLRCAFSSKQGKEEHVLLPVGVGRVGWRADPIVLARSMRSCFIVRPPTTADYFHQSAGDGVRLISSIYLMHEPTAMRQVPLRLVSSGTAPSRAINRLPSVGVGRGGGGSAEQGIRAAVLASSELAVYEPNPARIRLRDQKTLMVDCRSPTCADAEGGAHRTGHACVYLLVDILARRYTQTCHSAACRDRREGTGRPPRSRPLPREVAEAVGVYLASPEWALGEVVGPDFLEALGEME